MFARPRGRLLVPVAVVVVGFVVVEATDPAEGGRGRSVVRVVEDVAVDFARACVVVRGDCGLAGEVIEVEVAVPVGEGRDEVTGVSFDVEIIDFGLASLVAVEVGLADLGGPPASSTGGLRGATVFERPRPNIPEFGLLLVPMALAVGEGRLLPAVAVPARVLVAIDEAPGLGNLLGDMFRESADVDADAEAEAAAPLFLISRPFTARRGPSFLTSSCFCALLRPAVGCRRERDRFSPVAEDEDDMVLKGAKPSIVSCCLRGDNVCLAR